MLGLIKHVKIQQIPRRPNRIRTRNLPKSFIVYRFGPYKKSMKLDMKKLIALFALVLGFAFTSNAQGALKFKQEKHDFGTITEGTVATYSFEFTNTGKTPVVISNVQPSCGCTTPDWTREPVMPGKTGKVTASYNSAGRPGNFNKTVTVMNNGQVSQIVLSIQGSVAAKR
jgi:hypothetical protein